jgi:GNAT superfamily N-acetyltransferase
VIAVERVHPGDEHRSADILTEAAIWLAARGQPQWELGHIVESVAAAVAAGEAFVALVDGDDAATWFLTSRDELWWPELGADHDSRFFHKFAVRRRFAGTGISAAVLGWSITATRDAECRWLRLDCPDRPAIRRLYEAAGFELHDTVPLPEWNMTACRYVVDVTSLG